MSKVQWVGDLSGFSPEHNSVQGKWEEIGAEVGNRPRGSLQPILKSYSLAAMYNKWGLWQKRGMAVRCFTDRSRVGCRPETSLEPMKQCRREMMIDGGDRDVTHAFFLQK